MDNRRGLLWIQGLSWWHSGKGRPTCQCRRGKRGRFDPRVGKIRWSRKWKPTPVFLPGKSHGQRSLLGYRQQGRKESNVTEHTNVSTGVYAEDSTWRASRRWRAGPTRKNWKCMLKFQTKLLDSFLLNWSLLPVPVSLLWEHGPTARSRCGSRRAPGQLATPALDGVSLNNISCLVQVAWVVKHPLANEGDVRDMGSIPGLGRSPREGNGCPLQYSCLENSMDRGAWRATVHGVAKKSDLTEVT